MKNNFEKIIYQNHYFTIEHTVEHNVAGYLILFFNQRTPLAQQNIEALNQLGALLALTTRCIQEVIEPQRIYCLLFCEKNETPHFHLFPRTLALKQEYENLFGASSENIVSGPDLFSWMMNHKKGLHPQVAAVVNKLRQKLNDLKNNFIES